MNLNVNVQRLQDEIDMLASYSSEPAPVVTRVVFSQADQQARAYLKDLFAAANLAVREDAVGNTFARWIGQEATLPPVATGSHIDAIPNAGKYDGTVGVLGALEAIRSLQFSGFQPKRSIELILFTAEEPTRFGIGCLGSRMLSDALPAESAHKLKDSDGASLDELRAAAGFSRELEEVPLPRGYYSHFVELHIEQGQLLEREKLSIGIVESIAAPAALNLSIEGEGGHAGTVLMANRKDAFAAAAELTTMIETLAKNSGGPDTVATIGKCEVFPGAANSIPSRVKLTLDLRDTDGERRDRVLQEVLRAAEEIGLRRGVTITPDLLNADSPAKCGDGVTQAVKAACDTFSVTYRTMVSRAYHDSLFMAHIAPMGMIFIPCRNGVSHRPDEYSSPDQIATGVLVLAHTLAMLANSEERAG